MKKTLFACLLIGALIATPVFSQQLYYNGWYTYDDGKGSTITSEVVNKVIEGVTYMVHVLTGRVAPGRESFVGVTPQPDRESLEILKGAPGIKIRLRGDGSTLRLKVVTTDVQDYDYFGAPLPSASKEGWVTILYSELRQEGWGRRVPTFNKSLIKEINIQANSPTRNFQVEIIEIVPL